MPHEVLIGNSCFTASEAQKLLDRINKQSDARVQSIHGNWLYYVDLINGNTGLDKVQQLLQISGSSNTAPALASSPEKSVTVYVSPRNISPWSSKATSIAHVCGLKEQVHRVERGRVITIEFEDVYNGDADLPFKDIIYDRMTEILATEQQSLDVMFAEDEREPLVVVDIFAGGREPLEILEDYNSKMGLALSLDEMQYLVDAYTRLGRPPHDVELFMFAQVNSEHCRHKVFNAAWTIDGTLQGKSLFDMIKNTHKKTPDYTVSAYSDNAAVLQGEVSNFWAPDYSTGTWKLTNEVLHPLIKVETHNHPTAISPFPGAATGSGGEIRDEGAVGRGSTPKAGLCGFWVSDLLIPGRREPWEVDIGRPGHYASSLDIMLEAPIGSARFNNEFGRPCLTGTFRTLLTDGNADESAPDWRGYHKPIMIAGGIGSVRPQHALKNPEDVQDGAHVIVLGGPAMLIGLGGGAASSAVGGGNADLDFDSVQRGNPEMERRAQMVINTCVALGQNNPIAMIHDVGAGGLSNALPELVKDAGFGGKFDLRQVESADNSLSPLQIWCNEAQERYVLLVNKDGINRFQAICERERCGFSNVGTVVSKDENGAARLVLTDRESKEYPVPIDLPMDALFPPGRKQERVVQSIKKALPSFDAAKSITEKYDITDRTQVLAKATELVFSLPSVGSKMFLITIADRTVGGLTVQDQLVGPWQVPVADVAVTLSSYSLEENRQGEAMAMGEKPTLALISPAASARMAVVESLMNLGAAQIKGSADVRGDLRRVKLSANWMAAVNHPGEGAALFEAVKAIGMELCPELNVSIPVGKDSTSMKASWKDESGESKSVTAPVSVVISAFTLVEDVRSTWTPQLRRVEEVGESVLMYVDLAAGHKAMGGSALAQTLGQLGNEAPDVRDTRLIVDYFDALSQLHEEDIVLAYHDRSDGGLLTTIAEMMFAGRCAADISIDDIAKSALTGDILDALFNEELGAVFQIRQSDEKNFRRCFATCGPPPGLIRKIGYVRPTAKQSLAVRYGATTVLDLDRAQMHQWWSATSHEMQKLRDNPACAESEFAALADPKDPGISYKLKFDPADASLPRFTAFKSLVVSRPRVAILREQGVNGYAEMAFAFRAAGFDAVDIHMTDILSGFSLDGFRGLAACGGFSYGDVLGAGQGWAKSILMHENARKTFEAFFQRQDTFSLGVCNGCQMLSRLKELIPGAEHWPAFVENTSQQFEARYSMVQIKDNNSVFFDGMSGSLLPIVVSHGEGRAEFSSPVGLQACNDDELIPVRYTDNYGHVTEKYPFNPNGSPEGIAGVKSRDGRVLAMMPHPERTIMADVASWAPKEKMDEWGQYGPWLRMFRNARKWVG
ncbi:hypothetical protein VPNG_05409 [Cytospora leucostoma]|uniref:Phosphoribosylformylglycinamidine synthase n=1 Tax=Cytospora leucostoma TaxID=1230097 RepID=A0A423X501_9PEZI|nr:hypothetical protein VPNG_05409 [Cytospora leucostoma]